jgi:VanZ family protein
LSEHPSSAPTRVFTRRASDVSGARLGYALLAYLAGVIGVITLAPFRFSSRPVHGLTELWTWPDLVMNVVMFVPVGFVYQLTRPRGAPVAWGRVLTLGVVASGTIECAQLFAETRFTSLVDLTTNTAGAVLGAWLYARLVDPVGGQRAVTSFALDLPLMGVVYLLVPLAWLIGLGADGGSRAWLALPVVAFGSGIIGSVFAAYFEPARQTHRGWMVSALILWCSIALVPGMLHSRDVLFAGLGIGVGVGWLRAVSTARARMHTGSRRFELPTLRLLMPLLAVQLVLSALWPLTELGNVTFVWRGMLALLPDASPSSGSILAALERVSAFTIVGYLIAEVHGRDVEKVRRIAWRLVGWGGGVSVLLEVARGFHPASAASLSQWVLTLAATLLGGRIYLLQRAHVLELLTRRERSADVVRHRRTPVVTLAPISRTPAVGEVTARSQPIG